MDVKQVIPTSRGSPGSFDHEDTVAGNSVDCIISVAVLHSVSVMEEHCYR